MSYQYKKEKPELFTDDGQRLFLQIRDHAQHLIKTAGAFQMEKAISAGRSGSSWTMMACVDRLVELGEIVELTPPGTCAGQHRTFRSANSRL